MPFTQELRDLESVQPGYPFVSLYLDVSHNGHSAEEIRVFTRTRLREALARARSARERSQLEADARYITAYLEDVIHARVHRKSQGLGIFACSSQKYFHVVSSPEPFSSQLHVGDRPHLGPLRERTQGTKRILACLVDSRTGRILEIGPGSISEQAEIQSDVMRRHQRGGWSQMRFQRHVEDQVEHHLKDVAQALTHLADREPHVAIVLAGPEEITVAFREHLPDRIQQRILAGLPVSLKSDERDIVTRILESYEKGEETRQEKDVERHIEEAMTPSRGARGIDEVLQAANAHQVRRLFVQEDLEVRGWRCGSCGALGTFVPLSCNYCGGVIESTDVQPELISKVLTSGGQVHTLPATRELTRGVVASLRYRS